MLLFNKHIKVLLPQIEREPININKDDGYYEALKSGKKHTLRIMILKSDSTFFHRIYDSCPEGRLGSVDEWSDHRGKSDDH